MAQTKYFHRSNNNSAVLAKGCHAPLQEIRRLLPLLWETSKISQLSKRLENESLAQTRADLTTWKIPFWRQFWEIKKINTKKPKLCENPTFDENCQFFFVFQCCIRVSN